MKITIESTDMVTEMAGVMCRVWRGETESGKACDLAIPVIRARQGTADAELEKELVELPGPGGLRLVPMWQEW